MFIFPMAFVIGDGLSGINSVDFTKNYSLNVARIAQTSDVHFQESDNPHWNSNFLKMEYLQSISIQALELSGLILNKNVEHLPLMSDNMN